MNGLEKVVVGVDESWLGILGGDGGVVAGVVAGSGALDR